MKTILAVVFCLAASAMAQEFKEVSADALHQLTQSIQVPVIVELGEPGCPYCVELKQTFTTIAPSYDESKVRMVYVESPGTDLDQYVEGGYPTTRVFVHDKVTSSELVGSQEESTLRQFVDKVISNNGITIGSVGPMCPIE